MTLPYEREMLVEVIARTMCPERDETPLKELCGDDGRRYPAGIPTWKAWVDEAEAALCAAERAGFRWVTQEEGR